MSGSVPQAIVGISLSPPKFNKNDYNEINWHQEIMDNI